MLRFCYLACRKNSSIIYDFFWWWLGVRFHRLALHKNSRVYLYFVCIIIILLPLRAKRPQLKLYVYY